MKWNEMFGMEKESSNEKTNKQTQYENADKQREKKLIH